ncbi:MAG TPA: phosphotransferase [Steroidobacteraceae bacterium]|nr:phosphotransferase [Steroidobacteraceae bacterium]
MTVNQAGLTEAGADERLQQLTDWLCGQLHFPLVRLEPASNDASFRRYFRAWRTDGATRVVMDAPPDREPIDAFLRVASLLGDSGVHVPQVDAVDARRGFVLLEDLGSVLYLARLRAGDDPEPLYGDALQALLQMQVAVPGAGQLPAYDRDALEREMALMPEWFCARHLQLALGTEERALLGETFERLTREALAQPRVFVHRDYHARNLLQLEQRNPGIVDFQDALHGPVTYDLVSLLKDCYIDWPRERVTRWVSHYRSRLAAAGGPAGENDAQFLRWFDFIGLQRHIKVLGIFARLFWRDHKSGYLGDLPRTLHYVQDAAQRYAELAPFASWLERRVAPLLEQANRRALREAARG